MGKYNVLVGDIVADSYLKDHDLIVNATNPFMITGSGIAGAIFNKAGVEKLEKYTKEKYDTPMEVGEIRITPGFDLGIDIMFVQGPKKWEHDNPVELLIETYKNMLEEINNKGYKNILVPSLGTGIYGFTHEDMGSLVKKIITDYIKDKDFNIDLVIFDEKDKKYYL